jgi:LAO/AO transport system kinase
VNKADGEYVRMAKGAAQELSAALHLVAPRDDGWVTPVLTCSALERRDLDTVWDQLRAHRRHLERTGQLAEHRRSQDVRWMWSTIDDRLLARFRAHVKARVAKLEEQVRAGEITPTAAAERLLGDE